MNEKLKSLREEVLAKIKHERISMHSRAYFALKLAALAVVVFLVLSISIFLCNFIFFAIRISGSAELLGFGNRGLLIFIRVFPWWLLIVDIGLIFVLEWLVRKFRFGYKSPILYLLLGLLLVTVATAYAIDRATPVNGYLRDRAHEHRLPPPLNDFYERSERPGGGDDGMCRCTVTAIRENTIFADDVDVGTTTHLTIIVPPAAPRATTTGLSVGDVIFVAGDRDGNTIEAFGIRRLPPGTPSIDPRAHSEDGSHDYDDRMPGYLPHQ